MTYDCGITLEKAKELLDLNEKVYATIGDSETLWEVKSISKKYIVFTFNSAKCDITSLANLRYYGSENVKI